MANVEPKNDYSILAEHYDRAYNAALGNRINEIAIMRSLVEVYHPDASSLLDLGTGTGVVPKGFKGIIDDVVGLDISPEMLAVAKRNIPEVEFVQADMSDFELGREFDVAVSLFNAINHLKGIDTWGKLFKKVEQHLAPGGIFIFDIMSIGIMRTLTTYEEADNWVMEGGSYELEVAQNGDGHNDYRTTFAVSIEGEDGTDRLITGSLYQSAYPIAEVMAVAEEHLEPVLAFDFVPRLLKDGRFRGVTDNSIRPTFIYRKNEDSKPRSTNNSQALAA